MSKARAILAQLLMGAMLVPMLGLALACQPASTGAGGSMACCRQMHNSCMHGQRRGHGDCCTRNASAQLPAAFVAAHAGSAITGAQRANVLTARPRPSVASARVTARLQAADSPPRSAPLYQTHVSFLI